MRLYGIIVNKLLLFDDLKMLWAAFVGAMLFGSYLRVYLNYIH